MSAISRDRRCALTASAAARIAEAAAQCMWVYYRDHKSQLVSHVREYRAAILAGLITGVPVQTAFAPYFKPADTAKPLRRAA
jgi:hypothetical protein